MELLTFIIRSPNALILNTEDTISAKWLAPSKLLGSLLGASRPPNSLQPRLPENQHRSLGKQSSLIDIVRERWRFVKSENSKRVPNCWFGSYLSNVWFVKLHKILKWGFGFNHRLFLPYKKLLKPILSAYSRKRIYALFTQSLWQ